MLYIKTGHNKIFAALLNFQFDSTCTMIKREINTALKNYQVPKFMYNILKWKKKNSAKEQLLLTFTTLSIMVVYIVFGDPKGGFQNRGGGFPNTKFCYNALLLKKFSGVVLFFGNSQNPPTANVELIWPRTALAVKTLPKSSDINHIYCFS